MKTLREAILEALTHCERWAGGAAVVTDGGGGYAAIPGAYLTDISYTGPRDVVWRVSYLADALGPHATLADYDGGDLDDLVEGIMADLEGDYEGY